MERGTVYKTEVNDEGVSSLRKDGRNGERIETQLRGMSMKKPATPVLTPGKMKRTGQENMLNASKDGMEKRKETIMQDERDGVSSGR